MKRQITVNVTDDIVAQIDRISAASGVYNRSLITELALGRFLRWAGTLNEKDLSTLVRFQSGTDGKPTPIVRRGSGTYSLAEHATAGVKR